MPRVNTIIIPIIRGDFIGKSLETLYKYTAKDSFYVYVIDQTDSLETQQKYQHLSHFWIRPYRNLGFSKAVNTGIKLAQTPYVTLLNDDTEFINEAWWQGILDTFETDHHIVAVSPMSPKEPTWGYGLTNENSETWQPPERYVAEESKLFMTPKRPDGQGFTYEDSFTQEGWDFLVNNNPAWAKDTVCDAIAMWCPVFKKESFDKLGLLDEKFYPGGGEDYDMNARAYSCAWPTERDECDLEYHWRMVGSSRSWVWHHWGKSKDDISAKDPGNKLFETRPRWNALEELWPNGFDVWAHGHKDVNGQDVKYPYKRIPEVHEDEL